jgi:hypothetical protein
MAQQSFVFYDGPSAIDGAPIIGIAIIKSRNAKTGNMVQTFILRADESPLDALQSGADASVCGACIHRPRVIKGKRVRTCYVDVGKSVQAVFGAWIRGAYPLMSPAEGARRLAGRKVRLGAYGDPAAIPADHWRALLAVADGHTGYSHQWREAFAQSMRDLVMASADSESDRDIARAMGWRTFRVRTADESLGAREIVCPASDEGGNRRQCVTCMACDGAPADGADRAPKASVAIIVHGAMARAFEQSRAAA